MTGIRMVRAVAPWNATGKSWNATVAIWVMGNFRTEV